MPETPPKGACALSAVSSWPVRAAVGIAEAGGATWSAGPAEERFGWASVTKLLAALAVLVAAEEGTVTLDDPAGPEGSTIRHLLAHASGLAPDDDRVLAPPGTRRIYSNRGIELALAAVARSASMSWSDYLTAGVLAPLGLSRTTVTRSPAYGAEGPLVDLLRLAHELQAPTVVSPQTLAAATTAAWPGLPGVLPGFGYQAHNDWGLGIELRDHKSPHWTGQSNSPSTFGHFGRSGSFLWVDPTIGCACAGLAGTDFGPWAAAAWPELADAVVAARRAPSPGDGSDGSMGGPGTAAAAPDTPG